MSKIAQVVNSFIVSKKVFVFMIAVLVLSLPFFITSFQEKQIIKSQAATGRIYYISSSGNDDKDGLSPQTAWKSIAKVNATIFLPGDQILFEGGQTFTGNLVFDAAEKGTSANPITISSYGSGKAVINAGAGKGISLTNTQGFVIKNLIVSGAWNALSQSGNSGNGIELLTTLPGQAKLKFFRIDNVEVKGFKNNGIMIKSAPSDKSKSGFEDVRVTNCALHDNGTNGMGTVGPFSQTSTTWSHKNIYVGYCKFYNNRGLKSETGNTGSGIILSDVNGGIIEYSIAYGNGEYGAGPLGIWTWDANNITIQYNESYNNKSATDHDGGGFDLDGGVTNSVMQYNYSHDNYKGGFGIYQFKYARPFYNNTVRYNISQNNKDGEIRVWDGNGDMKNTYIYNNTVYSDRGPAFKSISPVSNFRVYNNNFMTTANQNLVSLSNATGFTFKGNNYYPISSSFVINWGGTTYTSLTAWRTATGQEKLNGTNVGYNVNPKLINSGSGTTVYKLQSTSPMKDKGLNLKTFFGINPGTRDYYGNAIPQNISYDIGAHERATLEATSPTATSLPISPVISGSTIISFTVFLQGIGSTGNTKPLHTQQPVTIELIDAFGNRVLTKTGLLTFDAGSGNFKGTVDIGSTIPTGVYVVKIKIAKYLRAIIPGIQTITRGEGLALPSVTLAVGDINSDNKLNLLDYNILMGCFSDLSEAVNCNSGNKILSDLDDDDHVNSFDYNLFLRQIGSHAGS